MSDISRPSWDSLYMALAFVACTRSPDPATKHGCFIVDKDHNPISFGYNGFPPGDDDEALSERPLKYEAVIHSEENAILGIDRQKLQGATVYVTGRPCSRCISRMKRVGVSKIVFGPISSACITELGLRAEKILLADGRIRLEEFRGDIREVFGIVENYMQMKGV